MRKTNIEKLKETLNLFLMLEVEKIDAMPFMVQHPIFEYSVLYDEERNPISILEPEGLEKIRKQTRKKIEQCKSASQCMMIMRKSYYLTFLKFTKEYLSNEDFSKLLAFAWVSSEAPNNDVNVSQAEILKWFNNAEKEKLMREEDFCTYTELPGRITVYRGIGTKSRENGISWTLDKEKATWFARRFSEGYVIQGTVEKKDILAFFNDRKEKEVIISPRNVKEKVKLP